MNAGTFEDTSVFPGSGLQGDRAAPALRRREGITMWRASASSTGRISSCSMRPGSSRSSRPGPSPRALEAIDREVDVASADLYGRGGGLLLPGREGAAPRLGPDLAGRLHTAARATTSTTPCSSWPEGAPRSPAGAPGPAGRDPGLGGGAGKRDAHRRLHPRPAGAADPSGITSRPFAETLLRDIERLEAPGDIVDRAPWAPPPSPRAAFPSTGTDGPSSRLQPSPAELLRLHRIHRLHHRRPTRRSN
jgi:argininosuccinate lyase